MKPERGKRDLGVCLRELCLPTVKSLYEEAARRAEKDGIGYTEYLGELVERECEVRRQKRIERRLRQSRLPLEKTWESFDFGRLPRKAAHQAKALLDGSFLKRQENVLAFGNPGSGKTHLLCAIGQELVRQDRRVYFTTCSLLVQELLRGKREIRLDRLIKTLANYDAVILDDIGYVQQDREEMEVLFTLLAQRYERGSVLITSNLPFSKWDTIFKDPMTTAAAIDRLVHHSVILELNVPSYRMEAAGRGKGAEGTGRKAGAQTRR